MDTTERLRSTLIAHEKPPRHPRLRAFDVTDRGELTARYEAFDLTLDRVPDLQTEGVEGDDGSNCPRDLVVWEGACAVAVIHYRGVGLGNVTAKVRRIDIEPGEDLDQAEADEDLDDEEVDDSLEVIDTRPGRPVPRGRWSHRPMPLLRASHTLCLPQDNWPLSLEVIALATNPRDEDRTASEADLPELLLAGWEDHEFGPVKLFVRVVCA